MIEKSILVVEDERPLLEAIRAKLELSGFTVLGARSVREAFNHLHDVPGIAAVWLDHYLLGNEDGFDFITKCKSDESPYRHIPIFLVSNTAGSDKVQEYMRLGAAHYYVKSDRRLADIINDIEVYLETTPL